jgi:hypothetical protein
MIEIEALDYDLVVGNDNDLEFEGARVELGDIIVVISNDWKIRILFLFFFVTSHCMCE